MRRRPSYRLFKADLPHFACIRYKLKEDPLGTTCINIFSVDDVASLCARYQILYDLEILLPATCDINALFQHNCFVLDQKMECADVCILLIELGYQV